MDRISVITPTGARPEAFALAERWMRHQTIQPFEWIVCDDGPEPTPMNMGQKVLRPEPLWTPAMGSTQHRNLELCVQIAKGDIILVWEDDDHYGPMYLEQTLKQLQGHAICGETPSRYFNVQRKCFRTFRNGAGVPGSQHAALCQTAFRRELLNDIRKLWGRGNATYPDLEMWRSMRGNLYLGNQVVGIKGMPGRKGISRAHIGIGVGWQGDPGMDRLRQWIGKDYEVYLPYGERSATA